MNLVCVAFTQFFFKPFSKYGLKSTRSIICLLPVLPTQLTPSEHVPKDDLYPSPSLAIVNELIIIGEKK